MNFILLIISTLQNRKNKNAKTTKKRPKISERFRNFC